MCEALSSNPRTTKKKGLGGHPMHSSFLVGTHSMRVNVYHFNSPSVCLVIYIYDVSLKIYINDM
jgi:hypothetical protein